MTTLASQFQQENGELLLASLMKPIGYAAFPYDGGFELEPIQTKAPFGSLQSIFSKAQSR